MVKAVAFDYGRVLSLAPEDTVIDEIARLAGLDRKILEPLVWKYRGEFDRGTVTGRDYYRSLLALGGVEPGEEVIEQIVRLDLQSWTRINAGTVKLMEDVKNRGGCKLGILSNMPQEFLDLARKTIPAFALADAAVFSCEVGVIKPEPAIYCALFAVLDCPPEELVFFDDIQENVDAALALGIRAFLWKDPESAREELRRLNLPV
ncbi:MAG: HAD family phosphatase [Spirochaetaceae bacterium]|jgi:putative hydrolase of the HAD superfamily|nr:HAD family phosphatase [Spirochaetaceae bacterium]